MVECSKKEHKIFVWELVWNNFKPKCRAPGNPLVRIHCCIWFPCALRCTTPYMEGQQSNLDYLGIFTCVEISAHGSFRFSFRSEKRQPGAVIEPTSLWSAASSLPTKQLLRVTLLTPLHTPGVRPFKKKSMKCNRYAHSGCVLLTAQCRSLTARLSLCSRSKRKESGVSSCLQAAESGISFAQPCTLLTLPAVAHLPWCDDEENVDSVVTERETVWEVAWLIVRERQNPRMAELFRREPVTIISFRGAIPVGIHWFQKLTVQIRVQLQRKYRFCSGFRFGSVMVWYHARNIQL